MNSKHQIKAFDRALRKADKRRLLPQLPALHDEAFRRVDCKACANCCKNYSPRFKTPDIKRISRHLKLKESVFIDTYLMLDEDGDFVVSPPCPFLGSNNLCTIYEVRPSDCARYPYTQEDVFLKKPQLTLKNATICPAVNLVLEKITELQGGVV